MCLGPEKYACRRINLSTWTGRTAPTSLSYNCCQTTGQSLTCQEHAAQSCYLSRHVLRPFFDVTRPHEVSGTNRFPQALPCGIIPAHLSNLASSHREGNTREQSSLELHCAARRISHLHCCRRIVEGVHAARGHPR